MTTKARISDTSRILFNRLGIDNVSARMICTELNISLGNFSYHYPDKNKIIHDLFHNMVGENHSVLGSLAGNEISILTYLESHKLLFMIQEKYKFFYLNLFEILTHNQEIKESYLDNSKAERKMAKQLLELYVTKGVLRKGIKEDTVDRLINVGQILNNSWLVDAELLYKGNQKKKLSYYMSICCGLMEPHLTEAALKEYNDYFTNL
jgi:AcrR family transcriptional regulator